MKQMNHKETRIPSDMKTQQMDLLPLGAALQTREALAAIPRLASTDITIPARLCTGTCNA